MEEIWKTVEGFEDYKISNLGNVKSVKKGKEELLNKHINTAGYYSVMFCQNGITKRVMIHRLVGLHFIENSDCHPVIDHIDRNKTNNNVSNLRWATYSQNLINKDDPKSYTNEKHIHFDKRKNKYYVRIQRNNIQTHYGCLSSLAEAVELRNKVLAELS